MRDLNIPFVQIKSEITGHDHDNLARTIQELKPTVDRATATRIAQTEAAADIKATRATGIYRITDEDPGRTGITI